ncbi:hypothetical protein MPH_06195 [Macrophomina phaseolina MS6]|uniref:Uncharacterized protein n=1 Tax=Macrophomina phaseolina (strain MS6) TaxID=1126212 RepID=K2S295_MACPH|nr:hypothetical protein MPH_06195 [Macrophomina phaseolina MS6]
MRMGVCARWAWCWASLGSSRPSHHPQWLLRNLRPPSKHFGPILPRAIPGSRHGSQTRWYSAGPLRKQITRDRLSKKGIILIKHKGWSTERRRWKEIPSSWKSTVASGSRREAKKRFRSPNEFLLRVLRRQGHAWNIPRTFSGKANLSYASPGSPHDREHPRYVHPYEMFRPSLQFYLATYLGLVLKKKKPKWDTPVAPKVLNWLRRQGYDEDDFRIWGRILAAETATESTNILLAGTVDGLAISKPVPIWVACLLCRRMDFSAPAIRRLLMYAESHVVTCSKGSASAFQGAVTADEKTFFLICIRLLRKARILHPESIEHITHLVVTRINPSHIGTNRVDASAKPLNEEKLRKRRVQLTLLYNRMLSLLALPTSLRPYVSAALQLRAQFDVLRRMSEYQPPMAITQMGYRSVARVQLAHLKTKDERKWGELKSASWPPWKEDRTAMDSQIGPEDGVSRAAQTIIRMCEAGYPSYGWDRIVQLFAGWDADGSPVIQNRIILPRIQSALVSALKEEDLPRDFPCFRDVDHEIWAARVRTTRTVEESWAIFLAYDAIKVQRQQMRISVYLAMFERIVGARKLAAQALNKHRESKGVQHEQKDELPGDRREALPTPESPHERLDPRLQPPSVDELFGQMLSRNIYPNNRCLAYLIQTAQKYSRALEYIQASRDKRVHALLQLHITEREIQAVPKPVFNSYIDLLTRNFPITDKYHSRKGAPPGDGRPLIHRAIALMDLRRSRYRPAWNRILLAIHKFDVRRNGNGTTDLMRQTLKVLERAGVELDAEGFQSVCLSFRFNAATRGERMAQQTEESLDDAWAHHLHQNEVDSRYLRSLFNKVVGLDDLTQLRSYLATGVDHSYSGIVDGSLSVPAPAILHDYIRALGMMGDYEGLLSIATFVHDNFPRLMYHCDNELNGQVRLRRAIVALRVFLERRFELDEPSDQQALSQARPEYWWTDENSDHGAEAVPRKMEAAPEELIMLVREKVEQLPKGFGRWPTEEEMWEYVQFGKAAKSI